MAEDAFMLYAPSEHNRRTWHDTIRKQKEAKLKGQHVFQIVKAVKDYEFFADMSIHHMVVFGKFTHKHKRTAVNNNKKMMDDTIC